MTTLAIQVGKGHLVMASAAILASENLLHAVRLSSLFDRQYLGMTRFATIPDCVALVTEDDLGHLLLCGGEFEILRFLERYPLYGNTLNIIYQLDSSLVLGGHPVNTVAKAFTRHLFAERAEVVFHHDLFTLRMTSFALAQFTVPVMSNKRTEGDFIIVARATKHAVIVVPFGDVGVPCPHSKTKINMAETTGVL